MKLTPTSNSIRNACEEKEEAGAGPTTEKGKVEEMSRKDRIFESKSSVRGLPCPTVLGLHSCPYCAQSQLGVAQGKCGLGKNIVLGLEGQQLRLSVNSASGSRSPGHQRAECCPCEWKPGWKTTL